LVAKIRGNGLNAYIKCL